MLTKTWIFAKPQLNPYMADNHLMVATAPD